MTRRHQLSENPKHLVLRLLQPGASTKRAATNLRMLDAKHLDVGPGLNSRIAGCARGRCRYLVLVTDGLSGDGGTGTTIEDLEIRLIEQEHRTLALLDIYFRQRPSWTKNDPRHAAIKKAFIWRLFFSPGAVATAGGGVALASIAVLVWQNFLIRSQNDFLQEQIQQQAYLDDRTRRSQLVDTIYRKRECMPGESPARVWKRFRGYYKSFDSLDEADLKAVNRCPASSPRSRADAVAALIDIEHRLRVGGTVQNTEIPERTNLSHADLSNVTLIGVDFRSVDLSNAVLREAELRQPDVSGTELWRVAAENAELVDVVGAESRWKGVDFAGAILRGKKGSFVGSTFDGVDFSVAWSCPRKIEHVLSWREGGETAAVRAC